MIFYEERRAAPGRHGAAIAWSWADTLQLLIEQGHSFSDIKQYTLGQLRAFTEAAERSRRRRLADDAVTARAAQYDSKEFSAYLKGLTS